LLLTDGPQKPCDSKTACGLALGKEKTTCKQLGIPFSKTS
jgi:hypothetical protein